LPTYYPNEEEQKNASLYAENVRKLMASYLNKQCSRYSYEDARLMFKAKDHNLPVDVGFIELHSLRKKYK
jgi:hypothetical protein